MIYWALSPMRPWVLPTGEHNELLQVLCEGGIFAFFDFDWSCCLFLGGIVAQFSLSVSKKTGLYSYIVTCLFCRS